jgi:predicted transcriptional regulator
MDRKQRFSFLLRTEEKLALQELAQAAGRSQSVILRRLIRQAAREYVNDRAAMQGKDLDSE